MTLISGVFFFLSKLFMGRVWLLNIVVINEIYLLLTNYNFYNFFRFMASHRSEYFTGATDATDAYEKIKTVAGNATWFN